ncbi:MAG: ABC transporter permease [Atopobiaceae bacterium]|nr:ABC transporter permease [Atopobiaceae bacterium]MBR1828127.1 ABC transporter permease [Atopobiaceae bacterium]
MFFRMIRGMLTRQTGKMLMIAFTIALGASLATAMLAVMFDVSDKVNQELKTYGANITVVPKESSVLSSLYEVEGDSNLSAAYLREDELGNIKTIFWAFNIVDFAPLVKVDAEVNGAQATVVGSWFNHHLDLPTGEQLDTGITSLRSWWEVTDGRWLDESMTGDDQKVMVGKGLAEKLGVVAGDALSIKGSEASGSYEVAGIFDAGGDEDDQLYAPLDLIQSLTGTDGKLTSIEVSALTTPDNEISRQAAKDPSKLTVAQYETWYCTAYASSICYQLQEVITDSVASPVRQVADSEGAILEKTELLMVLITILALLGSALGISNLVTASVMERGQEIGLLKAIGATDVAISGLVLCEIVVVAILGGFVGFGAGLGFAQIIGQSVFSSSIALKPMVIPLVIVLVIVVTMLGSISAIRTALRLDPVEVLHDR